MQRDSELPNLLMMTLETSPQDIVDRWSVFSSSEGRERSSAVVASLAKIMRQPRASFS